MGFLSSTFSFLINCHLLSVDARDAVEEAALKNVTEHVSAECEEN